MKFFKDLPAPILRLVLVIFCIIFFTLITRFILIPKKFTDSAYHKASATEREMAKEINYAGSAICADCHDDIYEQKSTGLHHDLSCETCHGPASKHANSDSPDEVLPDAPRSREFCPICHTFDRSRPTGFPQINPIAHNPRNQCIECHQPHDPKPPKTPEDCTACHANIALIKTVSAHAELECTVCHSTPVEHKINPRSVKPSKPNKREACGTCHSEQADYPNAPKVSLTSHEEKYVCWQCHYPHMPKERSGQEGRE